MSKNKNDLIQSGIIPYSKTPGITSFSSLWNIKHALGTDKLGHTGTLDSFADGLLVVLCGSLTHLVPHITSFSKTYIASICFGRETDTLDPTGKITKTSFAPAKQQVENILKKFTGAIIQVPPVYSALHVNGKRASELVRSGAQVKLEARQVFIYENKLLEFRESTDKDPCSYAIIQVKCSKGTYIRALARDIAYELGTCAHLNALRRIEIGPFKLEDSAAYNLLKPFTIENGIENEKFFQTQRKKILENQKQALKDEHKNDFKKSKKTADENLNENNKIFTDIRRHFLNFTPELAFLCGFNADILKKEAEKSYLNGRVLQGKMFTKLECPKEFENLPYKNLNEVAVFYENLTFAGMIKILPEHKLSYGFVVPKEKSAKKIKIFTWQDLLNGEFPLEWLKKGSALTVGSFDGMHKGHKALIDAVLEQKEFVHGIITFRNSVKSLNENFEGNIDSFYQKIEFCQENDLDFVVIIDFSDDFSKIDGSDFVKSLIELCNMKFIAEGTDFKCGYKGAFAVNELKKSALENNFTFKLIDDVLFEGEKISSSRIRKSVKEGDFLSVQKMLLRPFAYDAFALKFQDSDLQKNLSNSNNPMNWFSAQIDSKKENSKDNKNQILQILPSDGTYNVVVFFADKLDKNIKAQVCESNKNGFNTLHTLCCVASENDKKILKLLLPTQDIACRVKTINFISVK